MYKLFKHFDKLWSIYYARKYIDVISIIYMYSIVQNQIVNHKKLIISVKRIYKIIERRHKRESESIEGNTLDFLRCNNLDQIHFKDPNEK